MKFTMMMILMKTVIMMPIAMIAVMMILIPTMATRAIARILIRFELAPDSNDVISVGHFIFIKHSMLYRFGRVVKNTVDMRGEVGFGGDNEYFGVFILLA